MQREEVIVTQGSQDADSLFLPVLLFHVRYYVHSFIHSPPPLSWPFIHSFFSGPSLFAKQSFCRRKTKMKQKKKKRQLVFQSVSEATASLLCLGSFFYSSPSPRRRRQQQPVVDACRVEKKRQRVLSCRVKKKEAAFLFLLLLLLLRFRSTVQFFPFHASFSSQTPFFLFLH